MAPQQEGGDLEGPHDPPGTAAVGDIETERLIFTSATPRGSIKVESDPSKGRWGSYVMELRLLGSLAAPVVVCMATQQAMVITDQVMVGHLGTTELAAAALGNTWFNFWFYFMVGVATSLDTLCSQAFGAGNMTAYWRAGASSMIVLNALGLILAVALWYAKEVVHHLFLQPEELAKVSGVFCRRLIPGVWPLICGLVATKLLQTRHVTAPPAFIGLVAFLTNIGLNFLFIKLLGFPGCPIATSTSRAIQAVLLWAYVLYDIRSDSNAAPEATNWGQLMREGAQWKSLCGFLVLGLPGGFMMGLEATSFDITTALSARLGTVAVDAHSIVLAIISFVYLAGPFGLATAGSIRVGNLLGAGDAVTGRMSGYMTIIVSAVFAGIAGVIMYLLRWQLGSWFIQDQEVIATVVSLIPLIVLVEVFDGVNGAAQGALRGMGKQRLLLVYTLLGFWLCGLIPGYIMAFKMGFGLKGLWYGIGSGITVTAALCLVTFVLTDAEAEARLAQSRVEEFGSACKKGQVDGDLEGCEEPQAVGVVATAQSTTSRDSSSRCSPLPNGQRSTRPSMEAVRLLPLPAE